MALPINLVLVRHGQSEGNAAKRRSEHGDHTAYTEEFRNRHSSSLRLTDKGCRQAIQAGQLLQTLFPKGFDRYFTSEYARAKETAALLGIPGAGWYSDFYITERDWGELDICSEEEREERFGEALKRRHADPFFWRPPNGESFAQLCLRIDRLLQTLHRECSDKEVVVACHGEVMRAFQVRLERMTQQRFKELTFTENSDERIYNCQIIHYTRRNPETNELCKYANWVRMLRPGTTPLWDTGWQDIIRPKYSNKDLLDMVGQIPRMVS